MKTDERQKHLKNRPWHGVGTGMAQGGVCQTRDNFSEEKTVDNTVWHGWHRQNCSL